MCIGRNSRNFVKYKNMNLAPATKKEMEKQAWVLESAI